MPPSRNPFLIRTAEQSESSESDDQFMNLFGLAVLDILPEDGSWNRLMEIQSAPGGGKSTLLRLFTPRVLTSIANAGHDVEFAQLARRLARIGAIEAQEVQLLGVLVNCKEDYSRLAYLRISETEVKQLFWVLLHSRLALLTIRAVLQLKQYRYPYDVDVIHLEPKPDEVTRRPDARIIAGRELFERARDAEQLIIDSLNSIVPRPAALDAGPSVDDFFQLLNTHHLMIDGRQATKNILVMFDDAHLLDSWQRDLLLQELERHDQTAFASWVAMRLRGLEPSAIISEETRPNREGFDPIRLDYWSNFNFVSWFLDVGDRRARRAEREVSSFEGCLSDSLEPAFSVPRLTSVVKSERELAYALAGPFGELYTEWLNKWEADISESPLPEQAARWAQLQILMQRRIQNRQGEFTFAPLPTSLIENAGSDTLEIATIFMSERNQLPYFFGAKHVGQLASSNVDQFLSLSAALFDLLLNTGSLGRRRRQLSVSAQHKLIVDESSSYVRDIGTRIPYGQDVANIVAGIAKLCHDETWRPNSPISPGVTGVSILNSDRDELIEAAQRSGSSESRLLNALASAIAHNVLYLRQTRGRRDEDRAIFYVNRLMCPAFRLPLGFGGYKPRKTSDLLAWMTGDPETQQLGFDIGRLE